MAQGKHGEILRFCDSCRAMCNVWENVTNTKGRNYWTSFLSQSIFKSAWSGLSDPEAEDMFQKSVWNSLKAWEPGSLSAQLHASMENLRVQAVQVVCASSLMCDQSAPPATSQWLGSSEYIWYVWALSWHSKWPWHISSTVSKSLTLSVGGMPLLEKVDFLQTGMTE